MGKNKQGRNPSLGFKQAGRVRVKAEQGLLPYVATYIFGKD